MSEEETKAKSANDWIVLGLYAFSHEEYTEAIRCFDMALEFDPKNPQFYAHRADVHWACDEWDEAINDYEMAVFFGGGSAIQKMSSILRAQYRLKKELIKKKK